MTDSLEMLQLSMAWTALLFFTAFGAIVGSFLNVLVYRLPKGLDVVSPPSACPHCETRLTWRENIPVFGWLALGGKCRFCKSRVSAEYPLVEAFVGLLFGLIFAAWFMDPSVLGVLPGFSAEAIEPEWAGERLRRVWPMLAMIYALVAALIAATLIDARTFTIPLVIPLFMMVVGVVGHTAFGFAMQRTASGTLAASSRAVSEHAWTIPVVPLRVALACAGACAGLLLSLALQRIGVLKPSYHDYAEWEKAAIEAEKNQPEPSNPAGPSVLQLLSNVLMLTGPALALMFMGFAVGINRGLPGEGAAVGAVIGLVVGVLLRALFSGGASDDDPIWVSYPHARRETMREVLFLLPAAALAALVWWLAPSGLVAGPLWWQALSASLAGLLAGGGVVWGVRILGTLAIGKEAMGIGDVYLMAGAGAIVGWIDPTIAFFVAPFFGIAWALLSPLLKSVLKVEGTALPYGPHLAAATLLVVLFKPWFEGVLSLVVSRPIDLP
ncbi:MAG: prepilin peptidase [Planctomycetota bacterium]